MMSALWQWLHPCNSEQAGLTVQRDAAVNAAMDSSARVATKALDLIEETQAQRRAINELLSNMDKRR